MLDIGWSEMAVIALVALVVIGPKDLPRVMRTVGKWAHKARAVSREFQSGIDEMIRESELEDARKALTQTRSGGLDRMLENTIDPKGTLKKEAQEIEKSARDEQPAAAAKADTGKSDTGKADTGKAAGEPAEAPKATIVKQPTQIAPPHSVRPPAEPSGGAQPADNGAAQQTEMAAVPGKKSA